MRARWTVVGTKDECEGRVIELRRWREVLQRQSMHARAYLEREESGIWPAVDVCGTTVRKDQSGIEPRRWKYRLVRCSKIPWCTFCSQHRDAVRTQRVLARFEALTPPGQLPRFLPGVQALPVYDDGTGPGVWARTESKKFRAAVWQAVLEVWPGADGAFMSYQDFGEQGLAKAHPHQDFTVNGWAVKDGKSVMVEPLELRRGGYDAWWESLQSHLPAAAGTLSPGRSFDVRGLRVGSADYRPILAYKVRQLVDLRKLVYDAADREVGWTDYESGRVTWLPVQQFQIRLAEYEARLGAFGAPQEKFLHVGMGAMAERGLAKREAAMGAEWEHRDDCACQDCNEWRFRFEPC